MRDRGAALADDLERALEQAFDAADVARLRDRARLHTIVDRVFAQVVDEFALSTARDARDRLDAALGRAEAIVPLRFSPSDGRHARSEAEPGTSLWNGELSHAIAATVVLEAIGGPAIGLVHRHRDPLLPQVPPGA